ncbi:malectin-B precursor [Xenopus laevis]|uniref:malectin-B precursor n=1 Tax=Xenopus laevis TaxID=8355 RepID=UPI00000FE52C|nr:malectin-B precursor [Xenopus laevis]AAH42341.1 Mlec-b protein [Xenopus laevis]
MLSIRTVLGPLAAILLTVIGPFGAHGSGLADKVMWAVNAGGESHVDVHGIHYRKDPLEGRVGRASDYGMKLPILRSNPEDQVLYQTERYNEDSFGYDIPIKEEGEYVIVLKFAEVYFAQSQQKVFDIRVNGHTVVKDLDIFDRVGHSTAHDEIIPISIKKGKLSVQGEVSTFTGKLSVEFVKGYYDNPKVCALYIMKGTADDVPQLQPHPGLGKERRGGRKRKRKKVHLARSRATKIVSSQVHEPLTHMPLTTAASCFQSWWPSECLSPHSSVCVGYKQPAASLFFILNFFFFGSPKNFCFVIYQKGSCTWSKSLPELVMEYIWTWSCSA